MKNKGVLILMALAVMVMTAACNKQKDDPDNPAGKKKYAWAVGAQDSTGYGMILFSPDGGDSWTRKGAGSPALLGIDIGDIWAVDEYNVWAIGSDNVILKTSNSGETWERIPTPVLSPAPNLMSISIVNKTNIWISGSGGVVYRSSDNGGTWTLFDTAFFKNAGLQGIWAVSPLEVYVAGGTNSSQSRGYIAYTLNGGATWDSLVPADDYNRNEWIGVCSSGSTIVIYGCKAHYIVSTDGGITWKNDSLQTGGTNGADINDLIMLDPRRWWGAFDQGQIFFTTDGGTHWTEQPTGQGVYYLVGIDAWDPQLALVVGTPLSMPFVSPIIKTTDGGTTWLRKDTIKSRLWKVTFIKD